MSKCLCGHSIAYHNQYGCQKCHCLSFITEEQAKRDFQAFLQTVGQGEMQDVVLSTPQVLHPTIHSDPQQSSGACFACLLIVLVAAVLILAVFLIVVILPNL